MPRFNPTLPLFKAQTMNNPYQTPKQKLPKSEQEHQLSSGQFWLKIIGLIVLMALFLPALFYGLCFLVLSTGYGGGDILLWGVGALLFAALVGLALLNYCVGTGMTLEKTDANSSVICG